MMLRTILIASTCLAASAAAQNYYSPNSSTASGGCAWIPFGTLFPSPFSHETRYLFKVTAAELAHTPGLVTGLGFVPFSNGTIVDRSPHYGHLEITLDHHPSGAPLSTTFAANLTPAAVTVLSRDDHEWNVTTNRWNEIGLQHAFAYNGSDDLLVEIRTMDAGFSTCFRTGSGPFVYYDGVAPAFATGFASTGAIRCEISVGTARLSSHGRGCRGSNGWPRLTLTGQPLLGATVTASVESGPPGGVAAAAFGFDSSTPPLPIDLTPIGMTGCIQYVAPLAVAPAALDPTGSGSANLTVPAVPTLLGQQVFVQYALLDPAAPNPLGATTSGYGRIFVGI